MYRKGQVMGKRCISLFLLLLVSVTYLTGCSSDDKPKGSRTSPALADDSQFLYRVWVDGRNNGEDIYFARSSDHGVDWRIEKKLNISSATDISRMNPAIAVDEEAGNIYVVWEEERKSGGSDIYFIAGTQGGSSWGITPIIVNQSTTGKTRSKPAIDVGENGQVYVAWEDYRRSDDSPRIYINRTLDRGDSWLLEDKLVDPSAVLPQKRPAISVVADGAVIVAWEQGADGSKDILGAFNSGIVAAGKLIDWDTPFMINNVEAGDQKNVDITYGKSDTGERASQAFAVWQDNQGGNYDIFTALLDPISDIGNDIVTGVVQVSDANNTADKSSPVIGNAGVANLNNKLYVVWTDNRNGTNDVFYSISVDSAANWSNDERGDNSTSTITDQSKPAIESDIDLMPIIIWEDDRNGIPDIFTNEL